MAEETITILKVGTDEAVKSIADLRENVKILKKVLEETQVDTQEGWEQYQNTLEELKVNQNALKDAMYATTGTFEDVTKAATGTSESYNSLVHRMAALKEEFRATNDEMRRNELGSQINEINTKLKEMDALQGNFQRNVGNYAGGIKDAFGDLSKNVDVFRKSIGAVGGGLNGLKDGMEGISKSPMIATFGLLVSLAMKLVGELKQNETAMASIKGLMNSLKPVMDFFSGILETIAQYLADLIGKIASFLGSSGLFQNIIKGVVGVGNAIVQYVIAPFKAVAAAIKVFKDEGIKGIGNATKAFGKELKSGVSFKQNFQAGQTIADTFIAGAKSKKKNVKDAGKDLGKDAKDGFLEEMDKLSAELEKEAEADLAAVFKAQDTANKAEVKKAQDRLKELDKAYARQKERNSILVEDAEERAAKEYAIEKEGNEKRLSLLKQYAKEALDRGDLDAYLAFDQERADLEVEIETNALREKMRLRKKDKEDAEKNAKAQKELIKGVASATSDILSSIADAYEADEESSEKNAGKIKAIRIASATIDTISGAIGAYMQAVETIPPPLGAITGALQAATVTAAGLAQIAKMRSTKIGNSSGGSSASVPSLPSAPSVDTDVPNVRSVTSATEESRLNQMASEQRVYILESDIEAKLGQSKTRVKESSF